MTLILCVIVMEAMVKKYQQKFRKVRDEMSRWDELQSRLISRKEHIAHTWLPLQRLAELDWAPADREVVAYLLSHDEGAIPCSQET